jgi:predicted phage terminase large subunit-like protein
MVREEEARAELARRELARRHLVDFECYVAPYYRPARHHKLVGEYLEQVELFIKTKGREGIGRLLILEPPRHGKSEQMSRHFPAWVLGKQPDTRVILTSYGADLATKFSRTARDIVLSTAYRAVFGELAIGRSTIDDGQSAPVELAEDSRSVKAWDLAAPHRGGMMAAGVGGAIAGMGANLFLVDDPFKNREEAESELRREAVWEWWTSTAYTRLEDGAAVAISLTRWHGDDLAGRLLKAMATDPHADQWTVLCLPAVGENVGKLERWNVETLGNKNVGMLERLNVGTLEHSNVKTFDELQREKMLEGVWVDEADPLGRKAGEALWPEKYNEEDLERIKVNVGEYDWEALYQQSPYSRRGNFFRREWFTIVEAAPKLEEIVARMWFWDKAGSQKVGPRTNFACGGVMSVTKDKLVFVENVVRRQCTPGERDELMVNSMQADKTTGRPIHCIWHQQDPGSAGLDSAQMTNKLLVSKGFGIIRFETVTGDKEVRAGPWSSALQGGQVRLVRGAWNNPFIEEHAAFPKGTFDDQEDMASWGYGKLANPVGGRVW